MATTTQQALTPDAIYRRAGGRRRYNKQRQAARFCRRLQVMWLMKRDSPLCGYGLILILPGAQRAWAAELGVSESTISRDVQALNGRAYERLAAAHPISVVEDEPDPEPILHSEDEVAAIMAGLDLSALGAL